MNVLSCWYPAYEPLVTRSYIAARYERIISKILAAEGGIRYKNQKDNGWVILKLNFIWASS